MDAVSHLLQCMVALAELLLNMPKRASLGNVLTPGVISRGALGADPCGIG